MSDMNRKRHRVQKLLQNVIQFGFSVLSAEDPGKDVEASTRTSPAKAFCYFCQLDTGRVAHDAPVFLLVPGEPDDHLVPHPQVRLARSPLTEDCDHRLDVATIQTDL